MRHVSHEQEGREDGNTERTRTPLEPGQWPVARSVYDRVARTYLVESPSDAHADGRRIETSAATVNTGSLDMSVYVCRIVATPCRHPRRFCGAGRRPSRRCAAAHSSREAAVHEAALSRREPASQIRPSLTSRLPTAADYCGGAAGGIARVAVTASGGGGHQAARHHGRA